MHKYIKIYNCQIGDKYNIKGTGIDIFFSKMQKELDKNAMIMYILVNRLT